MDNSKYLTTTMQIRILRNKGLTIHNEKYAKTLLRSIGYSKLIDTYKDPFLDKTKPSERFVNDATFEEIVALYEFDRKLCTLTLEYILKIETKLKALISYRFKIQYGNTDYLKAENFDETRDKEFIKRYISKLKTELSYVNKGILPYEIEHENSKIMPIETLVSLLTLGGVCKFFQNMKYVDKENVTKMYNHAFNGNELVDTFSILTNIRNMCAHNNCIYSARTASKLKQTKYHQYFKAKMTKDYFTVAIILKILLTEKDFNSYQRQLESLFNDLKSRLTTVKLGKIYKVMGFPKNWKALIRL